MEQLRGVDSIPARALEVAILTACRTGEIINATWSEIDLDEATWTIPASRMKASKEHKIPLAPRVVDLLEQLPRDVANPYVFIGERRIGKPIGDRAMFLLLRELRPGAGLTVHGLRSSFSDWCH